MYLTVSVLLALINVRDKSGDFLKLFLLALGIEWTETRIHLKYFHGYLMWEHKGNGGGRKEDTSKRPDYGTPESPGRTVF